MLISEGQGLSNIHLSSPPTSLRLHPHSDHSFLCHVPYQTFILNGPRSWKGGRGQRLVLALTLNSSTLQTVFLGTLGSGLAVHSFPPYLGSSWADPQGRGLYGHFCWVSPAIPHGHRSLYPLDLASPNCFPFGSLGPFCCQCFPKQPWRLRHYLGALGTKYFLSSVPFPCLWKGGSNGQDAS